MILARNKLSKLGMVGAILLATLLIDSSPGEEFLHPNQPSYLSVLPLLYSQRSPRTEHSSHRHDALT